jgi:hypothetical protein
MEQTQKQKMLASQLYHANDPEIQADQQSAKAWMVLYNAALGATADERRELLRGRLAAVGNGAVIRRCDQLLQLLGSLLSVRRGLRGLLVLLGE